MITIRYFIALLQQTSWQAEDYFHILSRDSMRWLPLASSLVPAGALVLGYRVLGGGILILLAAAGSLYYGLHVVPRGKNVQQDKSPEETEGHLHGTVYVPDWKDSKAFLTMILWAILDGVLLIFCLLFLRISASIAPILCSMVYMAIPVLVPAMAHLESPLEKLTGNRYILATGRVRSLHSGLRVVALTGEGEACLCAQALEKILKRQYRCELAEEPVKDAVEAAHVLRERKDPLAEVLICRIQAASGEVMAAIDHVLQPSVIVHTGADFWSISDWNRHTASYPGEDRRPVLYFLNGDDEVLRQLVQTEDVQTYGLASQNNISGSIVSVSKYGTRFRVSRPHARRIFFSTALIGRQRITALIGAAAVAYAMGASSEDIAVGMRQMEPQPHHMQLLSERGNLWIDDTANTDPEEAGEALDVLKHLKGEKLLVTSGLAHLGAIQETANRNFGRRAAAVCDRIILIGEKPVFGLKQGILDAGFMPDHLLTAETEEEARGLIPEGADSSSSGNTVTVLLEGLG